jgi:hypothetical protein
MDVPTALRELVEAHYSPHVWFPVVLMAAAIGALVVHLFEILHVVDPGVPVSFRNGIAIWAVICWAVATFSTYIAGFVLGRLYKRA